MRILIADDDTVTQRVLQDTVTAIGHDVTLATDGLEAWKLIESESFDVVISDWVMPEIDGLELCRRLRAREHEPFCYVMLVTSKSTTEDIVRGIMAGANDFMTKPFDRAELHARLHAAERVVGLERSLAAKVADLEQALDEVRTLRRLLPICMYCKSIRNDEQAWADIEEYLRVHANTEFTHSICPGCYDQPRAADAGRDEAGEAGSVARGRPRTESGPIPYLSARHRYRLGQKVRNRSGLRMVAEESSRLRSVKQGVLLVQLGTPDEPTDPRGASLPEAEFLSDRRVVDKPRWFWLADPLRHHPARSAGKKSAALYQRIWTDAGSPLLLYTKAQAEGLQRTAWAKTSSGGLRHAHREPRHAAGTRSP